MFRKLVISILTRLAGRQRAAAAANVAGASKTLQNPTLSALLAVAALAYAISPIDAMPDFIPILGWLDDGLILRSQATLYLARDGARDPAVAATLARLRERLALGAPAA